MSGKTPVPKTREQWAELAQRLKIKVIHIAERDSQVSPRRKQRDEFVNTWSSEAFAGESLQPAELGWGTHEKNWPHDARKFDFGCGAAIYLERTGASTRVRTWTPLEGPMLGFLISHGESTTIPDYFTVHKKERRCTGRPATTRIIRATTRCCRCTSTSATTTGFRRAIGCCAMRFPKAWTNSACC
jgi:homospermidine synthase